MAHRGEIGGRRIRLSVDGVVADLSICKRRGSEGRERRHAVMLAAGQLRASELRVLVGLPPQVSVASGDLAGEGNERDAAVERDSLGRLQPAAVRGGAVGGLLCAHAAKR